MKEKNRSIIIIMFFKQNKETLNFLLEIYLNSAFDVLCKTRDEAIKLYTGLLQKGYKPFNNFEDSSKCKYILFSICPSNNKGFRTMGINDLVEYFEVDQTPEECDCYFASNIIYVELLTKQKKINVAALKAIVISFIANYNYDLKISNFICFPDRVEIYLSKDKNASEGYLHITIDYFDLSNIVLAFVSSDSYEMIVIHKLRDVLSKFVRSSNFFIGA